MKKIKYKVTGDFGENSEGDIIDAYILVESADHVSALVYHPKTSKDTCASIEFCVEDLQNSYWVQSGQNTTMGGDDIAYVNIDSQRHLNQLAKNVTALKYRNKIQK